MRAISFLLTTALAAVTAASPVAPRQDSDYVGYLISTFSDANPKIQFHLSDGNSATNFKFLNGGNPVLASTVGTKAVRDIFLTMNSARSEYYLLATGKFKYHIKLRFTFPFLTITFIDLDVTASGFSWDWATRKGSRGIVVWKSTDLVNWSGPTLQTYAYLP